jgi:plasmid stability protein
MAYKIVVSLPDEWKARLKERAWKERSSIAEYVRKVVGSSLEVKASRQAASAPATPSRVDAVSKQRVPAPSMPSYPPIENKIGKR